MPKAANLYDVLAVFICFLILWITLGTYGEELLGQQVPGKQSSVSDKDLRAFAKAYVEYHRIRLAYEPSLKKAQDAEESKKIQQEANSKIERALEKQGLTAEKYNQIFTTVNANEELRKKALNLVEQERKS